MYILYSYDINMLNLKTPISENEKYDDFAEKMYFTDLHTGLQFSFHE